MKEYIVIQLMSLVVIHMNNHDTARLHSYTFLNVKIDLNIKISLKNDIQLITYINHISFVTCNVVN